MQVLAGTGGYWRVLAGTGGYRVVPMNAAAASTPFRMRFPPSVHFSGTSDPSDLSLPWLASWTDHVLGCVGESGPAHTISSITHEPCHLSGRVGLAPPWMSFCGRGDFE